jgi:hypothetical protein
MVRVSADQFTKKYLGINEDVLSDSEAKKVCEKLSNNRNYKVGLSEEKLIIQRYLQD